MKRIFLALAYIWLIPFSISAQPFKSFSINSTSDYNIAVRMPDKSTIVGNVDWKKVIKIDSSLQQVWCLSQGLQPVYNGFRNKTPIGIDSLGHFFYR